MADHKPRVLIVDDFETVRMLFIQCLGELGVQCSAQAENGDDALRLIRKANQAGKPFDIVFADWNMPGMNGLELLQAIRKDKALRDLPFVMVTANSDDSAVVEAMRSGVSEYIVKPFDTKSISRTMSKVLTRFGGGGVAA